MRSGKERKGMADSILFLTGREDQAFAPFERHHGNWINFLFRLFSPSLSPLNRDFGKRENGKVGCAAPRTVPRRSADLSHQHESI